MIIQNRGRKKPLQKGENFSFKFETAAKNTSQLWLQKTIGRCGETHSVVNQQNSVHKKQNQNKEIE